MKTIKLEIEIPENKLDFFLQLFKNLKALVKVKDEAVYSKEELVSLVKQAREDYKTGKTIEFEETFKTELQDEL